MSYEFSQHDFNDNPHGFALQGIVAAAQSLIGAAIDVTQSNIIAFGEDGVFPDGDALNEVLDAATEISREVDRLYGESGEGYDFTNGQAAAVAVAGDLAVYGLLAPWVPDERTYNSYLGLYNVAMPHLKAIQLENEEAHGVLQGLIAKAEEGAAATGFSEKWLADYKEKSAIPDDLGQLVASLFGGGEWTEGDIEDEGGDSLILQ